MIDLSSFQLGFGFAVALYLLAQLGKAIVNFFLDYKQFREWRKQR